ncbi:MAG: MBL fold metallo-hydrolase [Clostridia bacterium]|nr:MBL fold metallo-hydrolase [Clostridia bacterium]
MKRFLALFLTLVMLATMVSCNLIKNPQETTAETTAPEGTTPEATTPEETTPVQDPIVPPTPKMAEEIVGELNPTQTFETTANCKEAIFANLESFDTVLGAFQAEGYAQVNTEAVEGAKLETVLLIKDNELVTLYWIASQKEARVTWEEVDAAALAPLQKTATTGGGTLTMVQIGVERVSETDNPNIGMCYVFKLSNGNALIIDGGFSNEKCGENVYNALAKLDIAKNEEGKYVIEAWIFTHVHGDHSGVVYPFSEQYANKVAVSYVLYQIPTNEALSVDVGKAGAYGEVSFFETAAKAFPGAVVLNPHVGLNYYFGNATVSMLYTPDVIWNPESKLDYYNNNSMIFKVSGGDTAFLCMGDAGDAAAARAWSLFEAFSFESGIFQLSHHGMSTGAGDKAWTWDNLKKIYEATGATTVALPLGARIEDGTDMKQSNGRWSILFDYPYNKKNQMTYIVRLGDAPTSNGYFARELLNRLVATMETGHNYLAEMSAAFGNVKSLHGYNGINMIDNGAGIITYISCADKTEMATVFQFANGEITVKKNEKLDEWLKLPEHNTADVIAAINPEAKMFESTFGVQEVVLAGISSKASIIAAFTTRGFEAVEVNMVEGAKFETLLFTNGMELATVYWKPTENEARILFEKLDENVLSSLVPNKMTNTGELTFVQIGVERVDESDNPMIGLCYVVKLSNGNAIVIDGGANNIKCAENIYNTLSKLNVARNAKGQYIIEAWIFTHGHSDHNGVMNAFAENYAKKVNVLNFLYQIPSNGDVSATGAGVAGEEAFFELCKATYPNATYINPKMGLNYYFGNATINMLYTPDMLWSLDKKITYYNDTSLIFSVRGGGTGFLCFGDAGEEAAKTSWNLFEESTFKNGLLQITHHGLTTQDGATGNEWEYVGNIYEATGTNLVVLPMGETNEKDNRNGRYSVLFQYPHSGYHMSFVVNKDNAPFSTKYFNADVFNCFISDVETGSNLMETKYNLGNYKTLYGYNGINMIDNGAGRITYISSRDKAPMVTVFSFAGGEVTVVENRELYEWLAEPTKIDEFESTFNSDMEIYTNVNSVEIFTAPLIADGYKVLDVTMIEGAKFETILLQKGTSLVTLYWFEESRDLRVAYDTIQETATAPLTPNAETGTGELIVAQVGVDVPEPGNQSSTENNPNIGLCYIFKLSNGHAIIIDGGFYYQSNADNIYKSLVSLDIAKDANGKYVVEAWIFTHGHGDHNGATAFFFPSYSQKVDVKNFVYQLPINKEISPTGAGYAGEEAFHELCKTTYPNANYINPRAGLTYYFGNAEVDMFHTPDFIWSHTDPIPDYNDSGIIFRVTGGGVEGALFMGDSGEHPSTATVKYYETSAFNSNIVQISHHGLNTQINEGHEWRNMKVIYENATAEYAFLPMGVAKPNVRSGRWSVICGWGYTGKQASFVINAEDDDRGVDQAAWNTFVSGILNGTIKDDTLLGYNGYNIIDNGQGRITYIHCSETDPMVTIMTFKDGKITVDLNEELYDWFAANK